jgi:hypothetical protein
LEGKNIKSLPYVKCCKEEQRVKGGEDSDGHTDQVMIRQRTGGQSKVTVLYYWQ